MVMPGITSVPCPHCGGPSRARKTHRPVLGHVLRRRWCMVCAKYFHTVEKYVPPDVARQEARRWRAREKRRKEREQRERERLDSEY